MKSRQVVIVDGVRRYRRNPLVCVLLDAAREGIPMDMNKLGFLSQCGCGTAEDWNELLQLLGYSECGYGEAKR